MEIYNVAPNKVALVMKMGEMVLQEQVFDGMKLKAGQMGQTSVSTEGAEFDKAKTNAMMFPQMQYGANGYNLELKGVDNVEGASAYKVMVESPSGEKKTQYYDVKSNLLIREVESSEGPQGPMTITNDFQDYKEVSGVMIPHKIILSGAMPTPIEMMLNVKANVDVPEGTFTIE